MLESANFRAEWGTRDNFFQTSRFCTLEDGGSSIWSCLSYTVETKNCKQALWNFDNNVSVNSI